MTFLYVMLEWYEPGEQGLGVGPPQASTGRRFLRFATQRPLLNIGVEAVEKARGFWVNVLT